MLGGCACDGVVEVGLTELQEVRVETLTVGWFT